jgi:hypothetical protein
VTGASDLRPVSAVPAAVVWLLLGALVLQIGWRALAPRPTAQARNLPAAPSAMLLQIASLGDPVALAKVLMLWLQAYDNPPGISIPFLELDYRRVTGWLDRILTLDPAGQYPLLAASRLYGAVPDPRKQRRMLDFVHGKFLEDPDRRWPWLAHAAVMARHRLKDLPRSLRYAQAITERATGAQVPGWARQMHALVLEQASELEAARALIGALVANGRITDSHELNFLRRELERLETGSERQRDDAAATGENES